MVLTLLAALLAIAQSASLPGAALAGTWTADMARSRFHASLNVRSRLLRTGITDNTVTITDSIVNAAGQEIGQGTTTFQVDGQPHPHDELLPGLMVVATWQSARRLETTLTRRTGRVDRVA